MKLSPFTCAEPDVFAPSFQCSWNGHHSFPHTRPPAAVAQHGAGAAHAGGAQPADQL